MFPAIPQAEPETARKNFHVVITTDNSQLARTSPRPQRFQKTKKEYYEELILKAKDVKTFLYLTRLLENLEEEEWLKRKIGLNDVSELASVMPIEFPQYNRNADPDEDPNLVQEYMATRGCRHGDIPYSLDSLVACSKAQVSSIDMYAIFIPGLTVPFADTMSE